MNSLRQSPFHAAIAEADPTWTAWNAMASPLAFGDSEAEAASLETLAMADVSPLYKFGLKGAGAFEALSAGHFNPPVDIYAVNSYPDNDGVVARLGSREFFVEQDAKPMDKASLAAADGSNGAPRVTLRNDAAMALGGERIPALVSQVCGVAITDAPNRIHLTRVAGVSAMVWYRPAPDRLRLWCDPSFGYYFWTEMHKIVVELGGRPVGRQCAEQLR